MKWFGEPDEEIRAKYFFQANLMKLDQLTNMGSSEKLSNRLWRRYGVRAISLLENIKKDPKSVEPIIEGADYLKCELIEAAQSEMIVTLEDFLRRRSKLSLIIRHEELKNSKSINDACKVLFGEKAEENWKEYFGE